MRKLLLRLEVAPLPSTCYHCISYLLQEYTVVRWTFQTSVESFQEEGTHVFLGWQAYYVFNAYLGPPPVQLCWLPDIKCLVHRRGFVSCLGFTPVQT